MHAIAGFSLLCFSTSELSRGINPPADSESTLKRTAAGFSLLEALSPEIYFGAFWKF